MPLPPQSLKSARTAFVLALMNGGVVFGCSTVIGLDAPVYNAPIDMNGSDTGQGTDGNQKSDGDPLRNDGGTLDDGSSLSDATEAGPDAADAAPPICNGSLACDRVMFVTSAVYSGALGGVGGGDAKCQSLATASVHPRVKGRTFIAWLSNTNLAAKDRIVNGTGKYVLPSGLLVASNRSDLLDGTIGSPINETESGEVLIGYKEVWTGTNAAGDALGAAWCTTNWQSVSGGARFGDTTQTNIQWTASLANRACTAQLHLYCVEL